MINGELIVSNVIEDKIKTLEEMTQIQCTDGNWNYDAYMHGMANGMIFSLSLMKDQNPKYLDAPEEWLSEKSDEEKIIQQVQSY